MEGAISSPSNMRVAVVTGGNKGIGFEVCRQLASGGVTVVLTARDETSGREAVEKLGLGVTGIVFHELEITDASSISTLADFLKSSFGKLDILVNNAAVGGVEYDQELDTNEEKVIDKLNVTTKSKLIECYESFLVAWISTRVEWMLKNAQKPMGAAKKSVQTNYYGTKHVTEALLPLLQSSSEGRIVNVSSDYGLLKARAAEEARGRQLSPAEPAAGARVDPLVSPLVDSSTLLTTGSDYDSEGSLGSPAKNKAAGRDADEEGGEVDDMDERCAQRPVLMETTVPRARRTKTVPAGPARKSARLQGPASAIPIMQRAQEFTAAKNLDPTGVKASG